MLVQFILEQRNAKNEVSFKAVKKVNIGNNDLSSVSLEIANFSKDIVNLCEKNAKLGYRSAINGIKKSHPMTLKLITDGETLKLSYKNYGKFCHESSKSSIQKFLKNNIEFTQKWQ